MLNKEEFEVWLKDKMLKLDIEWRKNNYMLAPVDFEGTVRELYAKMMGQI